MNWKTIVASAICGVIISAVATTATDQPPDVRNTVLSTRSVNGPLTDAFTALSRAHGGPVWVGYYAPLRPNHSVCCTNWDCGTCVCDLESRRQSLNMNGTEEILDSGDLMVLVRISNHAITRVRVYSENCRLNAGGIPLIWLEGVTPSASIQWLTELVATGERTYSFEDVIEKAVCAVALHDDPGVIPALESFVSLDRSEKLREHTVFWVGSAGGQQAIDLLNHVQKSDPSSRVRERSVFALTLPNEPEAIDALIRIARDDQDRKVRGSALFWLGNKAGEKAARAIEGAIEDDPDIEVKERAVFALSQLPTDEGIPLLVNVARTNRIAEVRKMAIFWLGQSDDPRVLDFFTEILEQ